MARLRLGLGFEGTLYPCRLAPGAMPDLSATPTMPMLERLVALAARYEITVYSLRGADGSAAAIRSWLVMKLELFFNAQNYPAPHLMALDWVGRIEITDGKDARSIDVAIDAGELPMPASLETIDDCVARPASRPA